MIILLFMKINDFQKIKLARKQQGFTLRQLAMRIGVAVSTLSHIENGRNGSTKPVFYAICKELNLEPDTLDPIDDTDSVSDPDYTELDYENLKRQYDIWKDAIDSGDENELPEWFPKSKENRKTYLNQIRKQLRRMQKQIESEKEGKDGKENTN